MKIALLCPVRCNSAYLAHFLADVITKTKSDPIVDLYLLIHPGDTWNSSIIAQAIAFAPERIHFVQQNDLLGRRGLNVYYQQLISESAKDKPDWFGLMCEDFTILKYGWNTLVESDLAGRHPAVPFVYLPRMKSTGSVCHFLSRGYVDAVDGVIAGHWSVDSWINEVIEPLHCYRGSSEILFDDFTAQKAGCLMGEAPKVPEVGCTYRDHPNLNAIQTAERERIARKIG